jgi:hypothetical protein
MMGMRASTVEQDHPLTGLQRASDLVALVPR